MQSEALKRLAAVLSGDTNIECKFAIRDLTVEHNAVMLIIEAGGEGIALPLNCEAAEEIAHNLVMPFRRAHLAREIARIIAECDDPSTDEGVDHAHKPH